MVDVFIFSFSPLTLLTDTKPPKKLVSVSVAELSKAMEWQRKINEKLEREEVLSRER